MFIVSKLIWIFFNPATLFTLALLFAAFQAWRRRWRSVRRWLAGLTFVAVALMILPVGDWALYPLETRFRQLQRPGPLAGVIVLGGAINPKRSVEWGAPQLNGNAERILTGLAFLKSNQKIKLYFTGGTGDLLNQNEKEADWARRLMASISNDMDRVVFERQSRNTWENAINLRERTRPAPGARYLLITSAAHMPRAMGAFRKAGWPVIAHPVDYTISPRFRWIRVQSLPSALQRLSAAMYEWYALIGYRLLGRTDAVFPGPRTVSTQ